MRAKNKKRPIVNPRNIPKASTFRRKQALSNAWTGDRVKTDHGYRIDGTTCKDYETYFEYIDEGQSTDQTVHAKKTRTYRIMGGQGFAILEKDGVQKSVVLVPGHELVIEAGISHQIVTTSTQEIELVVVQSAKYEASLKILKKSTTTSQTDERKLQSVTHDEAVRISAPRRRRKSKAAAQQRMLAGERGKAAPMATPAIQAAGSAGDPNFAVNLGPSQGRDMRGAEG